MDFLNTDAFLQMAREYNKRYSTNNYATILSNDNLYSNKVKSIFLDIFNLHNNLKVTFIKYKKFGSYFAKTEDLLINIKKFYEENFGEELVLNKNNFSGSVNNKYCAISMLSLYIDIFKFNSEVLNQIDKLKNCLLLNINELNTNNSRNCSSDNGAKTNNEDYLCSNLEGQINLNKKNIEYLINKLCKLQEIFIEISENLKEFYNMIN